MSSNPVPTSIYQIQVQTIEGASIPLKNYEGKVILIVNVASLCGFTPQYEGLEDLYRSYGPRGLVILGFPCDQFGKQEPGTDAEIQSFCMTKFSISFPLFAKIEVNGQGAHPLFKYLTQEKKGFLGTSAIKWNFTKFLIDRQGNIVDRFAPQKEPKDLHSAIEALL